MSDFCTETETETKLPNCKHPEKNIILHFEKNPFSRRNNVLVINWKRLLSFISFKSIKRSKLKEQ